MRYALTFNVISLVTFVLAVIFLAVRGLNLGVDFRGGTVIEVVYDHAVDFNRVRAAIDTLNLGDYAAQSFGRSDTALIRLPLKPGVSSAQLSDRVMGALRADDPSARQQRVEFVGPQVGKELYENGALALLLFRSASSATSRCAEWQFAVAQSIAPTCTTYHHPRLLVPVGVLAAGGRGARGARFGEQSVIADRSAKIRRRR